MTLADCIRIHEAARPAPAIGGLTPKGIAVIAVYQLRRALLDMNTDDRADVRGMLDELVTEPIAAR